MLGKLIKNEFLNRWKPILCIYGIISILGLLYAFTSYVTEETKFENTYFDIFAAIIVITFAIALYVSMVAIVLMSFTDYGKRMFKEQGYLTHTLPVKTIYILIARMICDLCVCASMGFFYPFIICVGERNFSLFTQLAEYISMFIKDEGMLELLSDLIIAVIMIVLFVLVAIWMYYAAYAIGHSSSSGKKLKSVFAYIIIYVVEMMLLAAFDVGIGNSLDATAYRNMIMLGLVAVVCCLVAITNHVCKNNLNLE